MGRHGWLSTLATTAALALAGAGATGASAADESTTAWGPATHSSALRDAAIVPPLRAAWDVTVIPNGEGPTQRPLVAGGRALLQYGQRLYALDAATGAVLWQQPVAGYVRAYDQGRLYVAAEDEQITALDAATGAVLWQREYDDHNGGAPEITATGGRIYALGYRWISAIDGATGAVAWTTEHGLPRSARGRHPVDRRVARLRPGRERRGRRARRGDRRAAAASRRPRRRASAATAASPASSATASTSGRDGGLWVRDRETGDAVTYLGSWRAARRRCGRGWSAAPTAT